VKVPYRRVNSRLRNSPHMRKSNAFIPYNESFVYTKRHARGIRPMKLCAPTTRLHADSQANNSSIFGVFTGKLNRLIMKKFLFPLMLLAGLLIAPSLSAQRIAIVDITRVL